MVDRRDQRLRLRVGRKHQLEHQLQRQFEQQLLEWGQRHRDGSVPDGMGPDGVGVWKPASPPTNAIDGNSATRWTTGAPMANAMWFQLDMQTPQTFNEDHDGLGEQR